MKHLALILISLALTLSCFGQWQCTPDPALSDQPPGFWPDTFQTVYTCVGCNANSRVIDMVAWTDTTIPIDLGQGNIVPVTLYIDAVKLVEFQNVPAGIDYGTNLDNDPTVDSILSPWGIWFNYGIIQNQTPAQGCIYFYGEESVWNDLSDLSNLGPHVGGAHLCLVFDYHIAATDRDISSQIPNNSWASYLNLDLGLGPFVIDKYWLVAQEIGPWSVKDHEAHETIGLANHPNPFSGSTVISIDTPQPTKSLRLEVYNSVGQLIEVQNGTASSDRFTFDGSKLTPGIYPYCVKTEDFSGWGKFVVKKEASR